MNPKLLKAGLAAAITAIIATSAAAWLYGIFEYHSFSPWIIVFAPVWQTSVVAFAAGLAFAAIRRKLSAPLFITLATLVAGILGAVLGQVAIGYSPHFSHDTAVIYLAISWVLAGLVLSIAELKH